MRRAADVTTPSPIAGDDPLTPPDPLAQDTETKTADPLAAGDVPGSDPKMPTNHSHWLRGTVFGAQTTVSLNGVVLGQYTGRIDKDITMKLHSGVNTVSFRCHPLTTDGRADLELVESEHTPPIPPLAIFHYGTSNTRRATTQVDQPETHFFLAH